MVNITPAKHQHVSHYEHVSMLTLASSSKFGVDFVIARAVPLAWLKYWLLASEVRKTTDTDPVHETSVFLVVLRVLHHSNREQSGCANKSFQIASKCPLIICL